MRKLAYYSNSTNKANPIKKIMKFYWGCQFNKLGVNLGFSIGYNSLGYGVVIPHHGTIVVNSDARVGNYSVLHTCTCIAGKKEIGDYFYLSTGSQVTGNITIGDGVTVAAHSLVNTSVGNNVLHVGAPAVIKRKDYPNWMDRDGEWFKKRVELISRMAK